MFYTGVGSRDIPEKYKIIIYYLAKHIGSTGMHCRSGSADGADTAFEYGALDHGCKFTSYLPWYRFNDRVIDSNHICSNKLHNYKEAQYIASQVHSGWSNLSKGAKALHTRNVYQVIGTTLDTPSQILICWAKPLVNGGVVGGTNTAVQLAKRCNVDIYNIWHDTDLNDLIDAFSIEIPYL